MDWTRLIAVKEKRLSTLEEVKAHPFFTGVDWAHLPLHDDEPPRHDRAGGGRHDDAASGEESVRRHREPG